MSSAACVRGSPGARAAPATHDAPAGRTLPATRDARRGFTLLELVVVLALVGLLAALVLPRLATLRGARLDASARQLSGRIRYLREEAALRGHWIRLAVDPRRASYQASILVETPAGAQFVDDDGPLGRPVVLPEPVGIDLQGPGVAATAEGLPATLFAPDGWAEPAVIHLDDGAGGAFSLVIDPAVPAPRLIDGRVDPHRLAGP